LDLKILPEIDLASNKVTRHRV